MVLLAISSKQYISQASAELKLDLQSVKIRVGTLCLDKITLCRMASATVEVVISDSAMA